MESIHAAVGGGPLFRFARLADDQLVLPSARHGLRKILDHCAQEAGFVLRTSVEADSFGAMIDLVRNGFGPTTPAARFVGDTFIELAAELVQQGIWAGHML